MLDDFDIRYAAITIERWAVWRAEVDRGDVFERSPTMGDVERVLEKLRPFLGARSRLITLKEVLETFQRNMSAQGAPLPKYCVAAALLASGEGEMRPDHDNEFGDGDLEEAITGTTFYRVNIGPAMFEARLGAPRA